MNSDVRHAQGGRFKLYQRNDQAVVMDAAAKNFARTGAAHEGGLWVLRCQGIEGLWLVQKTGMPEDQHQQLWR